MRLEAKIVEAKVILEEAITRFQPRAVFALYSGGHDSVTATHLAFNSIRVDAAVHVNTGIGVEATRVHVRSICSQYGWRLLEYRAADNINKDGLPDPQIYKNLVLEHGFPGPHGHGMMYARLKERQIRRLVREHKQHVRDKIMLISGCRQEESIRRMGHTRKMQVDGARVWVAPLIQFTKHDIREYLCFHSIAHNPVVERLGMSGECLCGAFAKPGELDRIRLHYPDSAAEIDAIQSDVTAAGYPWSWEQGPPEWYLKYKDGQDFLSDDFMPLCMSCPSRRGA